MICELDRVVVTKPLFTKGYKVKTPHNIMFLLINLS